MTLRKKKRNIFEPVIKPLGNIGKALGQDHEWAIDNQIVEAEKVEKKELPRFRPWLTSLVVVFLLIIFLVRLMDLQIVRGQENRLLAEGNRIRSYLVEAPRGQILDSAGNALVENTASYVMQIYPYNFPKSKQERRAAIDKISEIVSIDNLEKIVNEGRSKSFDPIIVKEDIDREEAMELRIKLSGIPGIEITALPKRAYHDDSSLAHVLGYIGKMSEDDVNNYPSYPTSSLIGKTGIEIAYDAYLRGLPGEKQVEINSAGQIKRVLKYVQPTTGSSVKLHINSDLQEVLQDNLSKAIQSSNGKSGVAIALDPRNGGVLSMVSLPGYDLNIFSGRIEGDEYSKLIDDPNLPLLNRAIGGVFPPGSSIKPFIASAGLDAGIINEDTTIVTPPEIRIGEWVFPDWKPHGSADVKKAIAESNNIFFYAVGGGYDKISGLGSDVLKKYLERFGFSSATGIDISGEKGGLVPDRAWKKKVKNENWYVGDTYHMAIGQGDLLVTPMELAAATMAIANGGTLYEPRVAKEIISSTTGEKERSIDPSIKAKDIINGDSLRIVRDGMRLTITAGSGYSTFGKNFPVEVAGKTGTAQYGSEGKMHAWFTSFAPYNDPKIVVTIFIEGGGEGYQTAAPVAKAAYEWYSKNEEALK